MKEAFEKLKDRFVNRSNDAEAQMYYLQDKSYLLPCMFNQIDIEEAISKAFCDAKDIVSEVEAEYGNGWITDRVPTKEECGDFRRNWFQTTVDANGLHTIPMQYEYTISRGKEISRWLAYGRISPWEVIAWMPLPEPYKPEKGD